MTVLTKKVCGVSLLFVGVLLPSGCHVLISTSSEVSVGALVGSQYGWYSSPPMACPLFSNNIKFATGTFPAHWVICRKDHFSFHTTGEEQQKKFQDVARTSYPMVLYLQKTRVMLKIQFSAVKQWESNLQGSGSHLELVHMGWKQSVSDSLCHSLRRMAESAVEKNPENTSYS